MDALFQKNLNDVMKNLRLQHYPGTSAVAGGGGIGAGSSSNGSGGRKHRAAAEAAYLAHVYHDACKEVRSGDSRTKAAALVKLLFLHMAQGADLGPAAFACVEAMSSPMFAVKSAGYLTAAECLGGRQDMLLLCTHALRRDLGSPNLHEVGLALGCLAGVAGPGLALDLAPDVLALLQGSRAVVRRKSALALLRLIQRSGGGGSGVPLVWGGGGGGNDSSVGGGGGGTAAPGDVAAANTAEDGQTNVVLRAAFRPLLERLEDPDPAVVTAAACSLCELTLHDPHSYLPLAPHLAPLLLSAASAAAAAASSSSSPGSSTPFPLQQPSLSPSSSAPPSVPSAWLCIKLVKAFAAMAAVEPRLVRKVHDALLMLLLHTPSKSLLLECVRAVLACPPMRRYGEGELRRLALARAAELVGGGSSTGSSDGVIGAVSSGIGGVSVRGDPNLRYLGLQALLSAADEFPSEVARHKDVVVACLDDAGASAGDAAGAAAAAVSGDLSIQRLALRLVSVLVTPTSLVPTVSVLLARLVRAAGRGPSAADAAALAAAPAVSSGAGDRGLDGDLLQGLQQPLPLLLPAPQQQEQQQLALANTIEGAILSMCAHERYARVADFDWYVDCVLRELCYVPTSRHGAEIGRQLIDLAARVPGLRGTILRLVTRVVQDTPALLVRPTAYRVLSSSAMLLGELGLSALHLMYGASPDGASQAEGSGGGTVGSAMEEASRGWCWWEAVGSLLQPATLRLPPDVQAVYVQAAVKVLLGAASGASASSVTPAAASSARGVSGTSAFGGDDLDAGAFGRRGSVLNDVLEQAARLLVLFSRSQHAEVQERARNAAAVVMILREGSEAAASAAPAEKQQELIGSTQQQELQPEQQQKEQKREQQQLQWRVLVESVGVLSSRRCPLCLQHQLQLRGQERLQPPLLLLPSAPSEWNAGELLEQQTGWTENSSRRALAALLRHEEGTSADASSGTEASDDAVAGEATAAGPEGVSTHGGEGDHWGGGIIAGGQGRLGWEIPFNGEREPSDGSFPRGGWGWANDRVVFSTARQHSGVGGVPAANAAAGPHALHAPQLAGEAQGRAAAAAVPAAAGAAAASGAFDRRSSAFYLQSDKRATAEPAPEAATGRGDRRDQDGAHLGAGGLQGFALASGSNAAATSEGVTLPLAGLLLAEESEWKSRGGVTGIPNYRSHTVLTLPGDVDGLRPLETRLQTAVGSGSIGGVRPRIGQEVSDSDAVVEVVGKLAVQGEGQQPPKTKKKGKKKNGKAEPGRSKLKARVDS